MEIVIKLLKAYVFSSYGIVPILHCLLTFAGIRAWRQHAAEAYQLVAPNSRRLGDLAERVGKLGDQGIQDAVAQTRHAVEEDLAVAEDRIRAMANAILLLGVCATLVGVFKATQGSLGADVTASVGPSVSKTERLLGLVAEPFAFTAIGALWAVLLLWLQSSASKLRAQAVTQLCIALDAAWATGYAEYQGRSHQGMAEALLPAMQQLGASFAGLQSQAFATFGTTIEGLGEVVTDLEETLSNAQESAEKQSLASTSSAEAVKRLADILEQMRGVEANYAKIADLGQTFKNDMTAARQSFEGVAGSTAMMVRDSANDFQAAMKKVHDQLQSLAGQLAAVEQYAAGTRDMAQRLGEVGDRFDRLFADYADGREEQARFIAQLAREAIAQAAHDNARTLTQAIQAAPMVRGAAGQNDGRLAAAIERLGERESTGSRQLSFALAGVGILVVGGMAATFVMRTPAATGQEKKPPVVPVDDEDRVPPPRDPPPQVVAQVRAEIPAWQTDLTVCANMARSALACAYSCTATRGTCAPYIVLPIATTVTDGQLAREAAAALTPLEPEPRKADPSLPARNQERAVQGCLRALWRLRATDQTANAGKVERCLGLGAGALQPVTPK